MKDMMSMMKKAQEMQAELQQKMAEMQDTLQDARIEGASGGGMVKVTLDGKHTMKAIDIDPKLLSEDDKEVLEDLIIAAFNDAKEKVENHASEHMKNLTGGLPMPPGLGNLFG